MLQILSDLRLLSRVDVEASSWILTSGTTGTFVSFTAKGKAGQPSAGAYAVPVWSEGNRDNTAGFSPDIAATGNVTVLVGTFQGETDQFEGTPAVGDALTVNADGKLKTASNSDVVLARCTGAKDGTTYLGRPYNAIQFITL